jgi:hypothetical protein
MGADTERRTDVHEHPPHPLIAVNGVATRRVDLIAVSYGAERVIGRYTFNHSP